MKKTLILIAGGTASGKTIVAEQISKQYSIAGKSNTLISLDNYYKDLDQLGVEKHSQVNWDDPNVFDWEKARKDIKSLLSGNDIELATYNYGTGYHSKEKVIFKSTDYIILEGIYSLYDFELRNLSDIKIFVEVDTDIRMMRRIKRDSEGRYSDNFDSNKFREKWENIIKVMHDQFIQPTSVHADIILRNNKELSEKEKTSLVTLLQSIVVK